MNNPFSKGISEPQLSEEEQASMTKAIEDIFMSEQNPVVPEHGGEEDEEGDNDGEEEVVDLEDQNRRTEKLNSVLGMVYKLWWVASGSGAKGLDGVVERLADSGRDPKWRIPLGDSGILEFFLEILSTHDLRHSLKIHLLRLVGNSCADTETNRARVVNSAYLPAIIFQLKDTDSLRFVIPVLFNICVDYEPAQLQASNSFLGKELIDLISSPRFSGSRFLLGYVCKLLGLLITQEFEAQLAPGNTPLAILKLATDKKSPPSLDDFTALVNTAISYLQHEKFQKALIAENATNIALTVLIDSYLRFDSSLSTNDTDATRLLHQTRLSLNLVLSDISALPEFQSSVPITSPFSYTMQTHIISPYQQLQVCACIMLGNLARSDTACEEFVHTCQIHKPLIDILKDATDSQLLHAALGFLKNLALPAKNKEEIGSAGVFGVLPRLWALDTLQQVQFSSISLARQLLVGKSRNVKKICEYLSDEDNPREHKTCQLLQLISLFERTDIEPIKMEISRLFTTICRVLHTSTGHTAGETENPRREFFYSLPDVSKPLSFMVTQDKWPAVRSEGWFAFALMARDKEGAACVRKILEDKSVYEALEKTVDGPGSTNGGTDLDSTLQSLNLDSPASSKAELKLTSNVEAIHPNISNAVPASQGNSMARIDRENAMVLLSELLKDVSDHIAVPTRLAYEDLLKKGSLGW